MLCSVPSVRCARMSSVFRFAAAATTSKFQGSAVAHHDAMANMIREQQPAAAAACTRPQSFSEAAGSIGCELPGTLLRSFPMRPCGPVWEVASRCSFSERKPARRWDS